MSIFDDLSVEYRHWRTRYFEDRRRAIRFAHNFSDEFKTYIGAPDSFKEEPEEGTLKPYVKAMKVVYHGDDTYDFLEPEGYFDVIDRGQDGYWCYGIRVTLEVDSMTWPKQPFHVPIRFITDDGRCKMRITSQVGGEFDFDISNAKNYAEAYKFIVSQLRDILRAKPSDQVQEKQQIGFLPP